MSDKLIKRDSGLAKQLDKSLQLGSLSDLVRVRVDSNIFLLLDCSGSMDTGMKNGKSRITGLRETVDSIQTEKRMKMVQFGSPEHECSFVEYIPEPDGGTPLDMAIHFAKNNKAGRAIVISDGEPNDQEAAMRAARDFGGRIDVVFVGDPGSRGEEFLKRLAAATGGESFTGDLTDPRRITAGVMGFLTAGDDAEDDDE